MEELKEGWAWVTWSFADGSKKHVLSTLSPVLLGKVGVLPKSGYLYDKNRREYVRFRDDAIDVSVSKEKPVYEKEVLQFASQFI